MILIKKFDLSRVKLAFIAFFHKKVKKKKKRSDGLSITACADPEEGTGGPDPSP